MFDADEARDRLADKIVGKPVAKAFLSHILNTEPFQLHVIEGVVEAHRFDEDETECKCGATNVKRRFRYVIELHGSHSFASATSRHRWYAPSCKHKNRHTWPTAVKYSNTRLKIWDPEDCRRAMDKLRDLRDVVEHFEDFRAALINGEDALDGLLSRYGIEVNRNGEYEVIGNG